MAKTKAQKKKIIEQLTEKIKNAKGIVFSSYKGLTVAETEELRGKLREENAELLITKKTLLKKSLAENKQEDVPIDEFKGEMAVIVGEDEVMPAKTVAAFAKNHEQMQFFGGILEEKFIAAEKVEELSKLPSKPELLARIVGSMKAPVSGFANVLVGNMRKLVYVLNAVKDSK